MSDTDSPSGTTGTPKPDGADAAGNDQRTSGTAAEDGRDAGKGAGEPGSGLVDYRELYLKNKVEAEELNRLREENRELKGEVGDPQPTDDPTEPAGEPEYSVDDEYELAAQARAGNVLAKELIRQRQEGEQFRTGMRDALTWQQLAPEIRDKATRIYLNPKNKGRYVSLRDVADRVEREDLKKQNADLRKRLEEIESGQKQPPKDVPRTPGKQPVDVNGKQLEVTTTTKSDFDRRKREAYAQGDMTTYRQMQRDLLDGKIKFRTE